MKEHPELRKPRKTRLQIHMREAEKSVSGALMRVFQPSSPEQKASLRALFSAAVAFVLCRGDFLAKNVLPQLNSEQAEFFHELEEAWGSQRAEQPPLPFAAKWVQSKFLPNTPEEAKLTRSLLIWMGLATRHIHRAIRLEPDPPAVDWGRREIAFREKFERLASGGTVSVDMEKAEMNLLSKGQLKGRAEMEVLGVYSPEEETYEAGWAAPGLPEPCRPYPVITCASQLFRATTSDAQAQAHRCAWLSGVEYLVEHQMGEQTYYLGLKSLESVAATEEFSLDDVRGEVLAKLRALEQALSQREAERAKDAFLSASRELGRRKSLFAPCGENHGVLSALADRLEELGNSISTQGLFGGSRDKVKDKEQEHLLAALKEIREVWQD